METDRIPCERGADQIWRAEIAGVSPGTRYGLRADGPWEPEAGHYFDPAKLLVDPYATEIDRAFSYDARLSAPRETNEDTATLAPKAILRAHEPLVDLAPPIFRPGGLIYEASVKALTWLHPEIPQAQRGTVAALAHPAIIDHLLRIGVDAVELMPITAWIDERHLQPLELTNAWGYNPVALMALDPRLCPGGVAELAKSVRALRDAGIGVILDLVFNHTGESDQFGPVLSMRGLDRAYYRRDADGSLINDTGCGNTLDCDHPTVRRLVVDALRHFVLNTGVDGFRFDLAPVLGRTRDGFDPEAPLLTEITTDPVLADRVLIAEPWDIGPGGYQLGRFPSKFLEWNDGYRDRVRRYWRGDAGTLPDFVTAISGSSDTFAPPRTRTVNFIAAHDGFTLADLTSYETKHNARNGEDNRDGHSENFSWNHGVEGKSSDLKITENRKADIRALLATLFASRGSIMLTAGDEFGRTQCGNNNAYAQDNEMTWLNWQDRDLALEEYCASLARLRRARPEISEPRFLRGATQSGQPDVLWLRPDGREMTTDEWTDPARRAVAMVLFGPTGRRTAILFNGDEADLVFNLPESKGRIWIEGAIVEGNARSVSVIADAPTQT